MKTTKETKTKRDFIKKAAISMAAFSIVPRYVLGGTGFIAPSDRLTKAVIGVGGMGRGHSLKKLVDSGMLGWPLKVPVSRHTGYACSL